MTRALRTSDIDQPKFQDRSLCSGKISGSRVHIQQNKGIKDKEKKVFRLLIVGEGNRGTRSRFTCTHTNLHICILSGNREA